LALFLTFGFALPAHAGNVRVLEAERMTSTQGAVVRAAEAAGGRALELRADESASKRLNSATVGALVLRARADGCGRAKRLTVTVDRGVPHVLTPSSRWEEQRVNLTLPPGPHRIRVAFSGARSKRCRALVDRVRLPAPEARPEAAGPVAPPTAAISRYVPLGAAVQQKYMANDPAFESAFRREFVSLTPENEMKMSWLQPARGEWHWTAADQLVKHAAANGKQVRGHALVFGEATPGWVRGLLLPGDAEAALREHVFAVVERYKQHVREWDVVNEALDPDGRWRLNPWFETLGPRYVELAFQFAREADPTAKLIYNEYGADVAGRKRDATVALVRSLKEKGLLDGVGLQMHRTLADAPSREQLEETMRLYEAMGLEVQVTEMDVLAGGDSSLVDRLIIQASAYRRAAEACATVAACTRFTVWGVTDKYSWLDADQLPLLLDSSYAAKPALGAVREVIGG
jgi:endo-1,4-beta-xylanase